MECRICGCDVGGVGTVACGRCGVPFHGDCWAYNGGCGIYGCGGRTSTPWTGKPEGTGPPFRLAPLIERLLRRLPGFLRGVIPPLVLGPSVGLAALLVGRLASGSWPGSATWFLFLVLPTAGAAASVLFGPFIRRNAVIVAPPAMVGASMALVFMFWLRGQLETMVAAGGFLTAAVVVTSLVHGVVRRLAPGLGALGATVVRGVLSVGLLVSWYASVEAGWYGSAHLTAGRLGEILSVCLLAFVACGPALALSSSALMHRLKAEAARAAAEE